VTKIVIFIGKSSCFLMHFSPQNSSIFDNDYPFKIVPDPEKCISCMRCISICPKGERNVDQNLWNMMAEKMAPVLGGRKENHLFL